jgi:hypothetical protein
MTVPTLSVPLWEETSGLAVPFQAVMQLRGVWCDPAWVEIERIIYAWSFPWTNPVPSARLYETTITHTGAMNDESLSPTTERMKLLIVDDHPAFRRTIISLFQRDEAIVTECSDGYEALLRFPEVQPDWVPWILTWRRWTD